MRFWKLHASLCGRGWARRAPFSDDLAPRRSGAAAGRTRFPKMPRPAFAARFCVFLAGSGCGGEAKSRVPFGILPIPAPFWVICANAA